MDKLELQLFGAEVRAGKKTAWSRVKKAYKQAGSVNKTPAVLGVSRRTVYQWLADVEGLREFVGVGASE